MYLSLGRLTRVMLRAFLLCVPALTLAGPCDSPPANEGVEELDRLFAENTYVYVARVDAVLRPGVLADEDVRETTKLFVFQPPLKGSVPTTLRLELGKQCMPDFSEGAVYLIFSRDLSESPVPRDVRAMLAYESGPYIEWIAEWVADKHQSEPMLEDFAALEWQHRLLFVTGSEASDEVLTTLQRRRDDVDERDLIWWLVLDGELYSNYRGRLSPLLKEHLLSGEQRFDNAVALIGKDGGLKLDLRYFNLDRIFSRIDSMPMRAREMREQ
ncbi:MAG: hypothetical protein Cons2KO_04600 [Congregibacter sp.]